MASGKQHYQPAAPLAMLMHALWWYGIGGSMRRGSGDGNLSHRIAISGWYHLLAKPAVNNPKSVDPACRWSRAHTFAMVGIVSFKVKLVVTIHIHQYIHVVLS